MLIAIWGRDGTGKSTLADALGLLFAKRRVTAIIDTDLTQPTLPARVNGKKFNAEASLGKAISGIGTDDAAKYLHQHPKQKQLFYAGLTDRDEYLSYEIGLEAADAVRDFIERCAALTDTVILDLSGQRTDPFVPGALCDADKIILPITPDVQGVCWFNAAKPFLEAMNTSGRVLPVAMMADRRYDLSAVAKAADIRFAAGLPYVREFRQNGADTGSTPAAIRYAKQVQKLCEMLKEVEA
jgi:MinD-like ATPase involved in chromosome partitioning or flagellar assembly